MDKCIQDYLSLWYSIKKFDQIKCIFQLIEQIEVFDLPTTTLSFPSQWYAFAVVTFTPQTMQLYSAAFEAQVEESSR